MFNSHIHTNHSHDCKVPMEEMILASIDAGFQGIAITDHFNADVCVSANHYAKVTSSVKEARILAEKYKDKIIISAGVEVSDVIRKPDYTARLLKALNPDIVIASVHNVFMNSMPRNLSRIDFGKLTDDEAYKIIKVYFSELAKVSENTDFDILAHLTLPLRYTNGKYGKKLTLDGFTKEIEKILLTLIKREKALEINTSEADHQLFDFMPDEEIVRKYFALGGRLITLGTDAHKSENIAVGFNEAKRMLRKTGFDSYCFYKNRKPVKIEL